ncbi:MAG: DNA repair protein RadA [Thermanaerothrix sp.]|uniref:DNA repair protein RadA n=1 Tax=Thermanaerothrix sp. TaxID=2972675 RepID=UPI003C79AC7A
MAKTQTRYVCQQCGRTSPRPLGRCPQCGAWDSMVEEVIAAPSSSTAAATSLRGLTSHSRPLRLEEIPGVAEDRWILPMAEFARVLGGGIVRGSVVLLGGDPGIGKSTLLLQMALEMIQQGQVNAVTGPVLYVSGEESERQIKMRALRLLRQLEQGEKDENRGDLFLEHLFLVTETNLDVILDHIRDIKPGLVIIDSIQTVYLPALQSSAGSVSQVRECASRLRELAKTSGLTVFMIGHVTKEGMIAGPRVLEHIVDTVLYLEGDRYQAVRLLRSVKNRFGATSEVGVFEMRETGMTEVPNPSEVFLAERMVNAPGSAIAVTMEGTRPLLVEIQGLTSPSNLGNPRRTPNGLDVNRLLLIVAVLTRRLGLRLSDQDVFVNVVGGLRIAEPAADLAVAAAIASSYRDVPIRADTVLIGEIGLSGELRWVAQMNARLREAAKLGFKTAIVPRRLRRVDPWPEGIEVLEARSLREALRLALLDSPAKSS